MKVSERDTFREKYCIILTLSEVAGEVPLEASSVIGCLTIDCQTSVSGAYTDKIFVTHLCLNFISNVLEFEEIALFKLPTLALDLKFEQIQSTIDKENPVYFVFPLL